MIMQKHYMKSLFVLCFTFLASICFASENEKRIEPIIIQLEPVEVVLLCPEGSKYEGELVPKWVSTDEATDFFCNDSEDESEVGE